MWHRCRQNGLRNVKQPIVVMAEITLAQTCLFCIILQFWELKIQTLKKFSLLLSGFYQISEFDKVFAVQCWVEPHQLVTCCSKQPLLQAWHQSQVSNSKWPPVTAALLSKARYSVPPTKLLEPQFSACICSIRPSEFSPHTLLSCSNGSMSSSLLWSRLLLRRLVMLLLCFLVLLALLLSGINKATRKARRTMHAPMRKGGPGMIALYRKTSTIKNSCFTHWLLHYELQEIMRDIFMETICKQVHICTVKWIFCI